MPVRLITAAGAPATGIVPADILGGIATVTKADGVNVDITLTNGVNWIEQHVTKAPGLYHLIIPLTMTDVVGPLQWSVMPDAAAFDTAGFMGSGTVEDLVTLLLGGTVSPFTVGTVGGALRLLDRFIRGRVKQTTAGTPQRIVYAEDNTTPLATVNTKDNTATPSFNPVFETTP